MTNVLRLENLSKSFGDNEVLRKLNLEIAKNEVVTLLGPSGCGKSTTLNLIAGILNPDSGDIFLRGRRVNDLAPRKRRVGMVFQRWALFPHMNAYENIAFGLRMRKEPKGQIKRKVQEMLEIVRLPQVADKFPSQLSGGMQQRIALARALVVAPDILLLDEPLSNLDELLRRKMQVELRKIQRTVQITTLFVTHNQEEALVISDRVAVMQDGNIVRIGTPREVYDRPQSQFVCSFLGDVNLFEGDIQEVLESKATIKFGSILITADIEGDFQVADQLVVGIRPEAINLRRGYLSGEIENTFAGKVRDLIFSGPWVMYYVLLNGMEVRVVRPSGGAETVFRVGDEVLVEFSRDAVKILNKVL